MVFSTVTVTPTEVLDRFAKSFGAMVAYLAVIVTGAFFLRAFFYQNNEIESFEYELCWDEGLLSEFLFAEFFYRKGWLLFSVAKPKLNHNGRCHQPQIAQTFLWASQRAKHLHAASARLGRKIIQVYKRLLLVLFLIEQVHLAFAKSGKMSKSRTPSVSILRLW